MKSGKSSYEAYKHSVNFRLFTCETKRGLENKMDKIIHLGIPHVGEQIFSILDSDTLIQCCEVSQIHNPRKSCPKKPGYDSLYDGFL